MPFNYNKVLVLGATSGIGWALASKLVENGTSVIVTGRRQEKLDEFVSQHGKDKAEAVQFDITQLDKIPKFVKDIMESHPDIDSVFLNSGIQRGFDFSKPESIDLSSVSEEMNTNYISYIHLVTAFTPYLQKQSKQTSFIFTTSGLALVPMIRCPNYCASKAALHHFILVLREQLKNGPGNIQVIEIFPPAVQTELHDEKHQPDIKNGSQIGMPLKDFTEATWAGLEAGKDQIPVAQPLHPDDQSGAETAQSAKLPPNGRLTPEQELEYLCDASVITPQQLSSLLSQIPAQIALHAPLSVGAFPGAVPANNAIPTAPMANLNINRDDEKKQGNNFYQPSPAATPAPPPAYAAPPPSMPPLAQATALYAYNGSDPGDLELQPNDHINVTEYMNAEWWKGRSSRTGQEGIFPRSYVRVIENTLPQSAPTNYGNMPLEVSGQGDGSGKVPSKGEEMGKKFGKKLGNAAIFGAGASIGGNIVNSIF
ncbi:NAD(P)-binding protein [Aureobasidium sp. EXF-3400]|nr:NAD(P)-binding protein [Aureobasidium sp. EXF-12344]KAI4779207.1 NAD(P)-binding protein [Aureobasidium sp. EXF-3400]